MIPTPIERQCLKKKAYDPHRAAKAAAFINASRKKEGLPQTAGCYLCEICGNWHVTSELHSVEPRKGGWGKKP